MADVNRFRRADAKGARSLAPDSAEVIEVGDMVYQEVDDIRAAGQFTYVSADLPGTQANFAAKFLGVAMTASANGETDPVTYATRGEFEFICAAAQFEVGDLVGPDDNATPDALLNQQVIGLGENDWGAIGRVTRRYSANTTRVLVEIFQTHANPTPLMIPLGTHTLGTADELVTDLVLGFPCKLVKLYSIVQTVMGAGAEVISVEKGATALDDTMTIAATAPVGAYDEVALDDASGDDLILVGDLISLSTDGGSASGAAHFVLVVKPFNMQVA